MNKKTFAERISERTGLDTEKSLAVLNTLDNKNIFSRKEHKAIAEQISTAVGCDTDRGEEIRKDMMQIISEEIKKQSKTMLIAGGAVIGALIVLRLFTGKEK